MTAAEKSTNAARDPKDMTTAEILDRLGVLLQQATRIIGEMSTEMGANP
jgi:hypothetical protein